MVLIKGNPSREGLAASPALIDEDSEVCGAQLVCRGLLPGSAMEIDKQIPWLYY